MRLVGLEHGAHFSFRFPRMHLLKHPLQSNMAMTVFGLLQNCLVRKSIFSPQPLSLLSSFHTDFMGRSHLVVPSQAGCGVQTVRPCVYITRPQLLLHQPHTNSYLAVLFPPRKVLVVLKPLSNAGGEALDLLPSWRGDREASIL